MPLECLHDCLYVRVLCSSVVFLPCAHILHQLVSSFSSIQHAFSSSVPLGDWPTWLVVCSGYALTSLFVDCSVSSVPIDVNRLMLLPCVSLYKSQKIWESIVGLTTHERSKQNPWSSWEVHGSKPTGNLTKVSNINQRRKILGIPRKFINDWRGGSEALESWEVHGPCKPDPSQVWVVGLSVPTSSFHLLWFSGHVRLGAISTGFFWISPVHFSLISRLTVSFRQEIAPKCGENCPIFPGWEKASNTVTSLVVMFVSVPSVFAPAVSLTGWLQGAEPGLVSWGLSAFLQHAFREVTCGCCKGTVPGAPPLPSPGPPRMPKNNSKETHLVPPEGHVLVKNMWLSGCAEVPYQGRPLPHIQGPPQNAQTYL